MHIAALADYLYTLLRNESLYLSYFGWRAAHRVHRWGAAGLTRSSFTSVPDPCHLCEKVSAGALVFHTHLPPAPPHSTPTLSNKTSTSTPIIQHSHVATSLTFPLQLHSGEWEERRTIHSMYDWFIQGSRCIFTR